MSQLSAREKLHLGVIAILIFFGIVLEALSISLILPLVGLLTDSREFVQNNVWIPTRLRKMDEIQLLQIALALFVIVYFIKSIFVVGSTWIQKKFTARLGVRLGVELFNVYIAQPYAFYARTNSSSLIRKSQNSGIFISGVLDPLLIVLTDGSIALVLIVGLLIVEPLGTAFVVLFFGLATLFLQRKSRSRLVRWGTAQNICSEEQLKILQHSYGGVREITLYGSHQYFSNLYKSRISETARIGQKHGTLSVIPRLWLEVVALAALLLVVTVMRLQDKTLSEIGITLTLYAGVAFRVLPTFSRLVASFQSVAFSRTLVEEVASDLEMEKIQFTSSFEASVFDDAIKFDNVSFSYEDSDLPILKNVSVEFKRGKSIGIVGPSGSGKSTFVDLLLGFLEPTSGSILVDGVDLSEMRYSWMRHVGYVPQEVFLLDDTIEANIAFGVEPHLIDKDRLANALKQARLESFVRTLPDRLDTTIGERGVRLSGGQRQRLGIARALYRNPDVLVFDEATSSVDGATESELMLEIAELGRTRTIIQIAHRVDTIKDCDQIYRVDQGRVVLAVVDGQLEGH
jgi:ABC-type multidrug transport system fused ATPase/permease subunit